MSIKKLNEELDKIRQEEILSRCFEYLAELHDHDDEEDWNLFWKGIIHLTEEEMEYYYLRYEDCQ